MTILVLFGGTESDHDEVVSEVVAVSPSRIQKVSVSALTRGGSMCEKELDALLAGVKAIDHITLITDVESVQDITLLRHYGAVFCHVRGPFAKAFNDEPIRCDDFHVAPTNYDGIVPEGVMDPLELVSELFTNARDNGNA
ncbi:hypothetical protein [Pseudoalteromonas sp. MMG024]|uniref:hypothetical protein n=1 Tax=Pseudoalteromonas sp. MMG024 TaxID=2909980 RepID=UPI001F4410CD|nr:hypothetical protein [Pseudoalteromonas sp. MMG024]MCF6459068.1 hypothetical protein [Pseudoalteromonas sp. MMG024]